MDWMRLRSFKVVNWLGEGNICNAIIAMVWWAQNNEDLEKLLNVQVSAVISN